MGRRRVIFSCSAIEISRIFSTFHSRQIISSRIKLRNTEQRDGWIVVEYIGTTFIRDTMKTQWIFAIYSPLRIILYRAANKETKYKEKVIKLPGKWQNYRYCFRLKIDKSGIFKIYPCMRKLKGTFIKYFYFGIFKLIK